MRFQVHALNRMREQVSYESVEHVFHVEHHQYDPSTLRGRFKNWLQLKLWKWYRSLAFVQHYERQERTQTVESVELNLDDIARVLMEQGQYIEYMTGQGVKTWVVGYQQFCELAQFAREQRMVWEPLGVQFPPNYQSEYGHRVYPKFGSPTHVAEPRWDRVNFAGIKVIMCPWLDGVIPIPDVEFISPRGY